MTRLRVLFGCAVFLASFLLFLVEPIAAKQLLPVFGGSAAVWITCLVFFQTALLVGYLTRIGLRGARIGFCILRCSCSLRRRQSCGPRRPWTLAAHRSILFLP